MASKFVKLLKPSTALVTYQKGLFRSVVTAPKGASDQWQRLLATEKEAAEKMKNYFKDGDHRVFAAWSGVALSLFAFWLWGLEVIPHGREKH